MIPVNRALLIGIWILALVLLAAVWAAYLLLVNDQATFITMVVLTGVLLIGLILLLRPQRPG